MDDNLTNRYHALFQAYGVGGSPLVFKLKERIQQNVDFSILRIDAAYFLLLNADHIVMRALSGSIKNQPQVLDNSTLENNALQYLEALLGDLKANSTGTDMPFSVHAVIRSLDRTWGIMGSFFSWI